MARHANPRFYVGPQTNELILGIGRAFGTQLIEPKPDVTITLSRRMCDAGDEITFTSYAVTSEGNAHFQIPDEFRTDPLVWVKGFYDGEVMIGDCAVGKVELVKAPGHYLSFGQSVQERCKGGTVWLEPECQDLDATPCNCSCNGDPSNTCKCSFGKVGNVAVDGIGNNCPTCFNEEFISRVDTLVGFAEPVVSVFQGTDLHTTVRYIGAASVIEGEVMRWTITVTNDGPNPASMVNLAVLLPQNVTPTSNNGAAGQGFYSENTGIWNIGNLPVGVSVVLGLEGTTIIGTGGTVVNVTSSAASSPEGDNNITPDVLTAGLLVIRRVDLVTVKTIEVGGVSSQTANVPKGGTFKFVIDVANQGGVTANNVVLTDAIDHPLFQSVIYSVSQGAFNPTSNQWVIGNISSGATAKLEATIVVLANAPAPFDITNTTSRATSPGEVDNNVVGDQLSATITIV